MSRACNSPRLLLLKLASTSDIYHSSDATSLMEPKYFRQKNWCVALSLYHFKLHMLSYIGKHTILIKYQDVNSQGQGFLITLYQYLSYWLQE